ncbi:hypothetical protein ACEYYA_00330 [Paracoccus sp. p3-h83]|uniref:hypothetical protein n=1 Tax=Paracoccus sp. p3-h83 TaxID=3342805 RepID=UPI0035B9B727
MTERGLIRAWGVLVALSGLATIVALAVPYLSGWSVRLAGLAILALSWAKAGVILADYLGLRAAPFWRRGFAWVMAIFMLVLAALYLAAGAR